MEPKMNAEPPAANEAHNNVYKTALHCYRPLKNEDHTSSGKDLRLFMFSLLPPFRLHPALQEEIAAFVFHGRVSLLRSFK